MNKYLLPLLVSKLDSNRFLDTKKGNKYYSYQSLAIYLSLYKNKHPKENIALGFPSLFDLQTFNEILLDFYNQEDVYLFPTDEILRLGLANSSKEMAKERLRTLSALIENKSGIVLFNSLSTIKQLETPKEFKSHCFKLTKNQEINKLDIIEKLIGNGYIKTDWINGSFEFASRGSILDIYCPIYDYPIRIEFDDEIIEEIRLFSPDTGLSLQELEEIVITPYTSFPLSKETINQGINNIDNEIDNILRTQYSKEVKERLNDIKEAISTIQESNNINEQQERLLPYFNFEKNSLFNYLNEFKIFIVNKKDFFEQLSYLKLEERKYIDNLKENNLSLPLEELFFNPNNIDYKNCSYIQIDAINSEDEVDDINAMNRSLNEAGQLIDQELKETNKVYICVEPKLVSNITNYLNNIAYGFSLFPDDSSRICIIPSSLSKGFKINEKCSFLSSKELYGISLRKSNFLNRFKEFHPIKKYSDLIEGDYVVHEDHGIAMYQGIIEMDGIDYLKLKYAGNAILYVPVFQFSKIRKYSGSEAIKPSLDVIGGSTWARKKAKIRSRLTFLTDKLLNIYAERKAKSGISFKIDQELEDAFADKFAFPLTESQIKAWDTISLDMEDSHPMDRLLAGDVGFGKTELAFKAAFRAIANGYQAAILCPTTILARQHYDVAIKRFEGFDINVVLLSRFTNSKQTIENIESIRNGKANLIIGTHRMLSNDVKFKNLGFLTIDEEQKFGVAQKERIKELANNVDVLSLSATPIPRTLQMSMLSIKSISTLDEPPSNRLPVKTYVVKKNEDLIKEVIKKELDRNGQVYYLHNRIEDIYEVQGRLQRMFPLAHIGVAHGRMPAQQISDVMNDFYDGYLDILVCTSIIESGLDVANVNTIIIENAQNFGLSTLYQIKGRVGRSNRLSYAYLLYDNYSKISDEGKQRLKAIKEFAELGSGYKLAQRDLAIRGAGNILGKEQAGFIDTLGYESYTELLNEVIKQRKMQKEGAQISFDLTKKTTRYLLSFTLDAHIPEDFANEGERINIYRELADCLNLNDLDSFFAKLKDSYGELPQEIKNLFVKRTIEILLDDEKVFAQFDEAMEGTKIVLNSQYSDIKNVVDKIGNIISPLDEKIQSVRFSSRQFIITLRHTVDYLNDLLYLVKQLRDIYYESN